MSNAVKNGISDEVGFIDGGSENHEDDCSGDRRGDHEDICETEILKLKVFVKNCCISTTERIQNLLAIYYFLA